MCASACICFLTQMSCSLSSSVALFCALSPATPPPTAPVNEKRYIFSAVVLFLFTEPIRPKGKTIPELLFEDFWRGLPVESTTHSNVRMAAIYSRHDKLDAAAAAAASARSSRGGGTSNGDVKHKAE